ncbi:hypothetical protein M3Y99_01767000 [Aphelenchoides fujianensis]|nr:hypothetical protein M3Y99_01767000 [Aphelenchoides fujianensis]
MSQNNEVASFATLVRKESLENYGGIGDPVHLESSSTKPKTSDELPDNADMEVFAPTDLDSSKLHQAEPSMVLFFQVLFPFIIAGMGMVAAGILLDAVQHWKLFVRSSLNFTSWCPLCWVGGRWIEKCGLIVRSGLKGNLEMTLSSRISTLANTGRMDTKGADHGRRDFQRSFHSSLMALIQTQAIIVTFLATGATMLLAWVPRGNIDFSHAVLICASSLTTASLASFFLSGVMIIVVLISRHYAINPDNVATPFAASLGDLTTLAILSVFGSLFLTAHDNNSWLNVGVITMFVVALPLWMSIASRDTNTYDILRNGWPPIIFSMLISSSGGFNGMLRSARVLLFLVIPGHIFFNFLIKMLHTGDNPPTSALFTSLYMFAALAQVCILLYVCQWLVALMWRCKIDPDSGAIPYLTALGDLLG